MSLQKSKWMRWLLILFIALATISPMSSSAAQEDCKKALSPRMAVGQPGQVLHVDGRPLNIRDSGTLSAHAVGKIPEGTPFNVLAGPLCADSINWWRLRTATLAGWAAEGDGDQYFIGPLNSATGDAGLLDVDIDYKGSFYTETFNYSRKAKNIRHFV